jgi:hypothetical protein
MAIHQREVYAVEVKDCDNLMSCILVAVTDIKGQPRQLVCVKGFDIAMKCAFELKDLEQFL